MPTWNPSPPPGLAVAGFGPAALGLPCPPRGGGGAVSGHRKFHVKPSSPGSSWPLSRARKRPGHCQNALSGGREKGSAKQSRWRRLSPFLERGRVSMSSVNISRKRRVQNICRPVLTRWALLGCRGPNNAGCVQAAATGWALQSMCTSKLATNEPMCSLELL